MFIIDIVWGWIPLVMFFGGAIILGLVLGGLSQWSVDEIMQSLLPNRFFSSKQDDAEDSSLSALVPIHGVNPSDSNSFLNKFRSETMDTYATHRLTGLPPAHLRRLLRGQSFSSSHAPSSAPDIPSLHHLQSMFDQDPDLDDDALTQQWDNVVGDMTPKEVQDFLERISKSSEKTEEWISNVNAYAEVEQLDLGEPANMTESTEDQGSLRNRQGFVAVQET